MNRLFSVIGILACLALLVSAYAPVPLAAAAPKLPDKQAKIANAMSAAPLAVAKDATILDWPAKGGDKMVELRHGSNGWTCMTDMPSSPGNDPACYDSEWMAWNDALAAGKAPKVTKVGVAYMLQGGSDPSNTDPFATKPAPGQHWVNSPPHVMLIRPEGFDTKVFSTDPKSPVFVMWAGTPFQHLHIAVPAKLPSIQDPNNKIRSAMSAAPLAIAEDAAILDWPDANGEWALLWQGTNGWTCLPDWQATPGNDPECLDATAKVWFDAIMSGTEPHLTGPGIAYLLQGCTAASTTDPSVIEPPNGEWIVDPPLVIFVTPEDLKPADFLTDPKWGRPFIMFEGTPYEHLMILVRDRAK
jgi:hypothetical protein